MAQSAYSSTLAYLPGQQVIEDGVVYQALVRVPPETPPPNSDFWSVVTIPMPGALPSTADVSDGEVLEVEDGAPVWGAGGGGGSTTLSVTYQEIGPFNISVVLPDGWDPTVGGNAVGVFTIGDGHFTGTLASPFGGNLSDGSYAADFVLQGGTPPVIQHLAIRTIWTEDVMFLLAFDFDGSPLPILWGNGGSGRYGQLNPDGSISLNAEGWVGLDAVGSGSNFGLNISTSNGSPTIFPYAGNPNTNITPNAVGDLSLSPGSNSSPDAPAVWINVDGTDTGWNLLGGTLPLSYNGVGPFPVPVSSVPPGYDGFGTATMMAQLTTGAELISGLLDNDSNPLPDGFTFPALIFVIDGTIYDIVVLNLWLSSDGWAWYQYDGGAPILSLGPNRLVMSGLPTSDPGLDGMFWSNAGVVTVSGDDPPPAPVLVQSKPSVVDAETDAQTIVFDTQPTPGNVLLAFVLTPSGGPTISGSPDGFTERGSIQADNSILSQWTHIVGDAEDNSYAWTWSESEYNSVIMVEVSGAAAEVDVAGTALNLGAFYALTASLVFMQFGQNDGSGMTVAPKDWTAIDLPNSYHQNLLAYRAAFNETVVCFTNGQDTPGAIPVGILTLASS